MFDTETDFPLPVAPAINRCGNFVKSAINGLPIESIPNAIGKPL